MLIVSVHLKSTEKLEKQFPQSVWLKKKCSFTVKSTCLTLNYLKTKRLVIFLIENMIFFIVKFVRTVFVCVCACVSECNL